MKVLNVSPISLDTPPIGRGSHNMLSSTWPKTLSNSFIIPVPSLQPGVLPRFRL